MPQASVLHIFILWSMRILLYMLSSSQYSAVACQSSHITCACVSSSKVCPRVPQKPRITVTAAMHNSNVHPEGPRHILSMYYGYGLIALMSLNVTFVEEDLDNTSSPKVSHNTMLKTFVIPSTNDTLEMHSLGAYSSGTMNTISMHQHHQCLSLQSQRTFIY